MSGLVDALLIVVAVVAGGRPPVPAAAGSTPGGAGGCCPPSSPSWHCASPALIDAAPPRGVVALLGAELLVGLAIGAGWAWTTRMWTEPDGAVWSRSTKASAAVWVARHRPARRPVRRSARLLGVHQDSSALLLALAATLLVRSGHPGLAGAVPAPGRARAGPGVR